MHPTDVEPVDSSSLSGQWWADRWTLYALVLPLCGLTILLALEAMFLWEKQHLQFFPLAVAAAIWFLAKEGEMRHVVSAGRRRFAWILASLGIFIAAVAILLSSPWLAHATAILLVFSWGLGCFGNLTVLRLLGICGLLMVTLPAPFDWDEKLVHALQALSSTICSRIMDMAAIIHVQRGNIIEIASIPLFVEEACSGVDSQYALMAVAGVLLLIGRAGLVVSLITIVTVPLWAILGNLLRIVTIVIGLEWLAIDLSTGTQHTVLGLTVFLVAAWAHWSSVQLLNFLELRLAENGIYLTRWRSKESTTAVETETTNQSTVMAGSIASAKEAQSRVPFAALLVPALLLLLLPISYRAIDSRFRTLAPKMTKEVADRFPGRAAFPSNLGNQTLVDYKEESRNYRNRWGQHSHSWFFDGPLGSQIASMDMPFRGWHSLWTCYSSAGWTIESQRLVPWSNPVSGQEFPFYELVMRNQTGQLYALHFSLFDDQGNPHGYDGSLEQLGPSPNRAWRAVQELFKKQVTSDNQPSTFQVQLLSRLLDPNDPKSLDKLRLSYVELRQTLVTGSLPVIGELDSRE